MNDERTTMVCLIVAREIGHCGHTIDPPVCGNPEAQRGWESDNTPAMGADSR